jgi:hypothetical protein
MGWKRRAFVMGLAGAAALTLPLAPAGATVDGGDASSGQVTLQQDPCWSTPGGTWPVTCVSPDHASQQACLEMRRFYIQAGYETSECIYNPSMAWGPWFFYHN